MPLHIKGKKNAMPRTTACWRTTPSWAIVNNTTTIAKSASPPFFLFSFFMPLPLFYKWTVESELIHFPLFTEPDQNDLAGSDPIYKKERKNIYWADISLTLFWTDINPTLFLGQCWPNSFGRPWGQFIMGWLQPN